jgi:WD40 repeat protein
MVDFNWSFGSRSKWRPIWSADETRVYICCYFYGNATTGESYYLSDEDTILDGHKDKNIKSLHHSHGVWLNDNFVLAQFDGFQTYRDGFLPVFDISARTFRNLGALANLPDAFNNMPYTRMDISPNRDYMWVSPGSQSPTDPQLYLVNLKNLKSQLYHTSSATWSTNGQYAMLDSQVLTLSNKELRPLPSYPSYRYSLGGEWHPRKEIYASIKASEDRQTQTLFILNVENITLSQAALPPIFSSGFLRPMIFWSPKGDQIALLAADNSIWQIDYPELKNIEMLTSPMPNSKDIMWSSDGAYLSLISGGDIYIVDTRGTP